MILCLCGITVNAQEVNVNGIQYYLSKNSDLGETLTLTATVDPANATDRKVTWSTSDVTVATVADGKVTAKASGTATIIVKAGDKEATCVVTLNAGITAISELSNTALYVVSQPNHKNGATSWAVQEGGQALKSNHDLGLIFMVPMPASSLPS